MILSIRSMLIFIWLSEIGSKCGDRILDIHMLSLENGSLMDAIMGLSGQWGLCNLGIPYM